MPIVHCSCNPGQDQRTADEAPTIEALRKVQGTLERLQPGDHRRAGAGGAMTGGRDQIVHIDVLAPGQLPADDESGDAGPPGAARARRAAAGE